MFLFLNDRSVVRQRQLNTLGLKGQKGGKPSENTVKIEDGRARGVNSWISTRLFFVCKIVFKGKNSQIVRLCIAEHKVDDDFSSPRRRFSVLKKSK